MALERAIADLTRAILDNTRALRGLPEAGARPKRAGQFGADPAANGAGSHQEALQAQSAIPVTYDVLRGAIKALAVDQGEQRALEVLTRFGVSHARDLTPEQWQPVLDAVLQQGRDGPSAV